MRRQAWLLASVSTLFASTLALLSGVAPATAGTAAQLLPPVTSVCPPGTKPLLGQYKGLCQTVTGVIFNPITKQILYSPTPTPPPLPVNPLPGGQPNPPSTQPPGGSPPHTQPGAGSGTPTHLISSSVSSNPTYSTPYGKYFGSFGGGTQSFSPNSSQSEYRHVYYMSGFGQPLQSDVSGAVASASRVMPVSTTLSPRTPDEVWLLVPFGLVLLVMVSYLVLEPDADRAVSLA